MFSNKTSDTPKVSIVVPVYNVEKYLRECLDSLLAQPMVQGGVVLSTCNRTELYLSVEEQDNLQEALIRWIPACASSRRKTKGTARR